MFLCRFSLPRVVKSQISFSKNASTSVQSAEKWDLMCGICLERKPILTRPLNKLEISFSNLLNQIEKEKSQKSEHELRYEADQKRAVEFQKGKISTEDFDKAVGQSAAEFEDESAKELNEFKPASRVTEADVKNDLKSTERMLDKHLLLLTTETLGKDKYWLLPYDLVKEGETLRQAAERILMEKCGSMVRAKFYGNAPCGFYKYKYPKEIREGKKIVGAKMFFMKAQYLKGSIQEKNVEDYHWASREELTKQLHPPYLKAVTSFLIEEEPVDMKIH